MNILKYLFTAIIVVALLFVSFGFFQDQKVAVSRTILVKAPVSVVYEQFNDLNQRLLWSPWEAEDTGMVVTLGEITQGVGASYSWKGIESGNGSITYVEAIPNHLIESEINFGENKDKPGQGLMLFKEASDGTQVTWELHVDMGMNPFMRIMGKYMDEMVGPTFEKGLKAMKAQSEKIANATSAYPIEEVQVTSLPSISILDSCDVQSIGPKMNQMYQVLGAFLNSKNLQPSSFPRCIFHTYEAPEKVVMETIFVLNEQVESTAPIKMGFTYGGQALKLTYTGAYENASTAWDAIYKYAAENHYQLNGSPWEEYPNSPETVNSSSELITHIYIPVKGTI